MTPAEVILGFLDALQVPLGRIPASPEAQAGLYRSLLAGKRMLVLLDSARDADQVRPLLSGSASCLVVVTSRHQLVGLAVTEGARETVPVVFTEEEARDLLALRLGMQRLASEPEAVRLTALTARLPLALSIAAARPPGAPASGWPRWPRSWETPGGPAGRPGRWRRRQQCPGRLLLVLSKPEQPRSTDVPAARPAPRPQMCPRRLRPAWPVSHLTRRATRSPSSPAPTCFPSMLPPYAFHDLLREYAAEQARDNEDQAGFREALHRVLDHYLYSARAADSLLDPAREPHPLTVAAPQPGVTPEQFGSFDDAMAWFEAERRVLLASIALGADAQLGTYTWQLPWALTTYFRRRGGRREEWAAVQHTALTAVQRIEDAAEQAYALADLGRASVRLGILRRRPH